MFHSDKKFGLITRSFDSVLEIERKPHADSRGYFERIFCSDSFAPFVSNSILQINHTYTTEAGTIRGLHYQLPPSQETKIVYCLKGAVFDVVLDVRRQSTTYGKFASFELSAAKGNFLVIPAGFAHGFQTLTNDVEMLYLHDAQYCPQKERGVRFTDVAIGIELPLSVTVISEKDHALPLLNDIEGV